jgi:uncharacterized membrane protein HdeD (DUF308 family)
MEYVLYLIGVVLIGLGCFTGFQVFSQLQQSGLPLQNVFAAGAFGAAAGIVVAGVLFLGFATVIDLLRKIAHNTEPTGGR